MICETRSRPYFCATYSMTRSRPSMQKSMSKSGIDTRSGLRNLSNSGSYLSGSMSVMPSEYATSEPAPEPRPGPTGTSLARAQRMKSATMRKYPAKPILLMTASSVSRRWRYSSRRARCDSSKAASRAANPRNASSRICASTDTPSGSGYTGSRDSPSFSGSEQRRAISTVLRSASGRSANRLAISAGERRYCASV